MKCGRNLSRRCMFPSRLTCRIRVAVFLACLVFGVIGIITVSTISVLLEKKYSSFHVAMEASHSMNYDSRVETVITQTNQIPVSSMSGKIAGKDFFKEIIAPSISCADRVVEMIICVSAKRDNFAKRDAIRVTWGSYARHGGRNKENKTANNITTKSGEIILVFFFGSSPLLPADARAEQYKIEDEAKFQGDIYQADYIDTYENLTLKSISIIEFVSSRCPNAHYVVKVDEDVYVNIPLLLSQLQAETRRMSGDNNIQGKDISIVNINSSAPHFVYGYIFMKNEPERDKASKWFTPKEAYKPLFYPDYLSGSVYAMSGAAALKLYRATLMTPIFWLEDVYITGMCTQVANVQVVGNNHLFTVYRRKPIGCSFINSISGHNYSSLELVTIHSQLNSPSRVCPGKNKRTEGILMDDEKD